MLCNYRNLIIIKMPKLPQKQIAIATEVQNDDVLAVWIIILIFRQFRGYCNLFLRPFSTFSYLISVVTKHEKLILFNDLDAEFHVLKLLFEDFLLKIIRKAENDESLILRVKSLCSAVTFTTLFLIKYC